MEADLMRRVLPAAESAPGWAATCRDWAGRAALPVHAGGGDRPHRPAAVHLDGLNLSRAWCLRSLAAALPADDPVRRTLLQSADRHAEAGLAHVASGDYVGEHWLASVAVVLVRHLIDFRPDLQVIDVVALALGLAAEPDRHLGLSRLSLSRWSPDPAA